MLRDMVRGLGLMVRYYLWDKPRSFLLPHSLIGLPRRKDDFDD